MTQHNWQAIPDTPETWVRNFVGRPACWLCGRIAVKGFEHCYTESCESNLSTPTWVWGAGQIRDPFASVRGEVGPHGMPVRGELGENEREGKFDLPKNEAERRPGLAPETIDQDAYREFMRGL